MIGTHLVSGGHSGCVYRVSGLGALLSAGKQCEGRRKGILRVCPGDSVCSDYDWDVGRFTGSEVLTVPLVALIVVPL